MVQTEPWGIRWRSKTPFILATVALGLFSDLFLWGLPVPLLPYMLEDRLHLPIAKIQSHSSGLLAAHAISSVIFCPISAILVDQFAGRKIPYIVGVLLLLLSTVLFFLGDNIAVLVIARILQGSSGALVWTVGQALLIDTVGARNLGKATGSVRKVRGYHESILTTLHIDLRYSLCRCAGRASAGWHPLPRDWRYGTTCARLFAPGG